MLFFSPSASVSVIFPKFYPSIDAPPMPETPFPMVPGIASFAGPIDTITFRLRPDLGLTNFQKKAYAFVRLSTYFQTPIPNAPPYTGHHGFQVLLFIPTAKSPWAERFDWLQTSNRLGSHGQWVSVTGPVVGILDSRLLVESLVARTMTVPFWSSYLNS